MTQAEETTQRVQVEISRALLAEEPAPGKVHDLVAAHLKTEFKRKGATSKEVIGSVCRGAMGGLVLTGRDPVPGAMEILQAVADIVQERSGDPMRTLGFALEGIAVSASVAGPEQVGRISMAIDAQYMGAGATFSDFAARHR